MSYCPECGEYQAHVHLGWLELRNKSPDLLERIEESLLSEDGVHHARVDCDNCGCVTLLFTFQRNADKSKLPLIINFARKLFDWAPLCLSTLYRID